MGLCLKSLEATEERALTAFPKDSLLSVRENKRCLGYWY